MNTEKSKQPFKVIEIPLTKFNEEVLPLCQEKYDQHKTKVLKLISENKVIELQKEIMDKSKSVKQLKDLMYELNTLRNQVEVNDIRKFELKSASIYRAITTLLNGYSELSRISKDIVQRTEDAANDKENLNPFEGAQQIQMMDSLNELKLQQYEETCERIQALHDDTEDLHAMYGQLHEMVHGQAVAVDDIAEAVESTSTNVEAGLKHLVVAHRLKSTAYPMTGAVVGGVIGGPIGLVAGAKLGALAAICCATLGYAGGKIFKTADQDAVTETTSVMEKAKSNLDDNESVEIKKSI